MASPQADPLRDRTHRARSERPRPIRVLHYRQRREIVRVSKLLRHAKVGGLLIIAAALLGFVLANSPAADWFFGLRDTYVGPESLGLRMNLGHWAADGLLAVFFFIVGLELKHEFTHGALSKFSTAIVPIVAAVGGVAVPALIYVAFTAGTPYTEGWAIPAATDIAFAIAVLGIVAPGINPALRMFLLTLAVVDDLLAIAIIAVFYTAEVQLWALGAALVPIALYGLLAQKFTRWFMKRTWSTWLVLLPIGVVAWAFFYISGVHATIAGVLLAFTVPVASRDGHNLAEEMAFRFQPLSIGFAVPVFAFFSAGVSLAGEARFPFDPIVYGVALGLVFGKPIGIAVTTWAITRFSGASIGEGVRWRQVFGVASLAGVGFTVSLLIAELSFTSAADQDTARLAVMSGSILAALLAAVLLFERKSSRSVGA